MGLLLDTNILIPLADQRAETMSRAHLDALTGAAGIFVSLASLWEIAIKVRLGKLPLLLSLTALPEFLSSNGIHLVSVEAAHVLADVDPWPDRNDPFDRLLLAVCQVEGFRLLTTDAKLIDHPLAWRPASA